MLTLMRVKCRVDKLILNHIGFYFAQPNMNEEKKDKKTEILGIIAITTAGLCWLCVFGAIPFEFIYLLPVSTIAAFCSLKNILSKMAMALLVLLAPGYIVIHYASLAPAL